MTSATEWSDTEVQTMADKHCVPVDLVRSVIADVGACRELVESQLADDGPTIEPISRRLRAAKARP